MLQKLRVLQLPRAAGFRFAQQGAKGEAVVVYRNPLALGNAEDVVLSAFP